MAATNPTGTGTNQEPEPEGLKKWWAGFKRGNKKETPPTPTPETRGIFGVPLQDSIKYANVAISLVDEDGKSFIYGYVPIVVAKCGVFLKEKATDVEGIFRLSGSEKRIKELKAQFDQPTRYGKGLNWDGYTVHDAANVLRRYLNLLPQPIVPLGAYEKFRDPLRDYQTQTEGDTEGSKDLAGFDHEKAIETYQQLIKGMPPLNRQLLLYVLDLLSVFASKADINRMNSANLAAIFQPGLLSHPNHDMKPQEYRLSQDVLIFLIDNQDSFLIGMTGTAADEKTVREVQSGAPTPQPATPTKSGLGRSASSASAGTENGRRLATVRRNLSVSSRNSRASNVQNAPNSPGPGLASPSSGVHRSNTVPSKKSPALSSRVNRGMESPNTPIALSPAIISPGLRSNSPGSKLTPPPALNEPRNPSPSSTPTIEAPSLGAASGQQDSTQDQSKERLIPENITQSSGPATPGKSRNLSSLLKSSPTNDNREQRQPNKLKKKRMPSGHPSANSSTHSLNEEDRQRPLASPGLNPTIHSTAATPVAEQAPRIGDELEESMGVSSFEASKHPSDSTLRAKSPKSPTGSHHSRHSATDHATDNSEVETADDGKEQGEKRRSRWRFSHSAKKSESQNQLSSPPFGAHKPAGASSSSVGSWNKASKSTSNDIPSAPLESVLTEGTQVYSESSGSKEKDLSEDPEKKGLFGRIKNKIQHVVEDRKERDVEKDRAKSPPRDADRSNSKQNISAVTTTPADTNTANTAATTFSMPATTPNTTANTNEPSTLSTNPVSEQTIPEESPTDVTSTAPVSQSVHDTTKDSAAPVAQSTDAASIYEQVTAPKTESTAVETKPEVKPTADTTVSASTPATDTTASVTPIVDTTAPSTSAIGTTTSPTPADPASIGKTEAKAPTAP